eukprot:2192672-Alexandrium_andersonii.AAC.1
MQWSRANTLRRGLLGPPSEPPQDGRSTTGECAPRGRLGSPPRCAPRLRRKKASSPNGTAPTCGGVSDGDP